MLNLQNINEAKKKLKSYDPIFFQTPQNSFRFFLNKLKVNVFRHVTGLEIDFEHPVTVITGTNKVGKTSLLLLIACSHFNFKKYDATKPKTILKRYTWRDVLPLTRHEATTSNYSYELMWRVGNDLRHGEGKRLATSQAWTGLGKYSADARRINAQIRDKEVRLIDLERLLPARNFSNSLMRKIATTAQFRVHQDIEQAFAYILDIPGNVIIHQIGSHINKIAYLINSADSPYSSYNAASGEESLLNILTDIFDTPDDSLILIDEIEAGFHPSVQRKLADVIQYVSWKSKKQFIITTHSPSLLSAFPQKSRKFIDRDINGVYNTINNISVNAAFSKMDSKAYPLLQLYCEDSEAEFIIRNILIEINLTKPRFDRLINIIKSGAIDKVKNDYERHKTIYSQLRIKMGFCCVFDGDYKNDPNYSSYHNNPNDFSFFLYPYTAPEKFLVKSYLLRNNNPELATALNYNDHHALYQEMVNLGLAADRTQAQQLCWNAFLTTPEYTQLNTDLKSFLLKTAKHFSELAD